MEILFHCTRDALLLWPNTRQSALEISVTFFANILQTPLRYSTYFFRKPMKCRFQQYLVCMEIQSTFHVGVECISAQKIRHSAHSNQRGCKCRKIPKTAPFFLGTWTPIQHINAWDDPTHHAKRQLDRCTHVRTTTQQRPHWLQWDAPNSPRPIPLTITNGIRIQSTVLPQYTFRRDAQTHTQTDRWARRQVRNRSAYAQTATR